MNNKKGASFVTIIVVIGILALLLRIGIEEVLKVNISQNESAALSTLKLISTGLENYANNSVGVFPADLSILTKTTPAYLDKDYVDMSPVKGYTYRFSRLDPYGYSCRAEPLRCNLTGKMIYTITTGGVIMSEECSKKE